MPAAKMARVVLNAFAKSDLLHHLEIVGGSLLNPLLFDKLVVLFKMVDPLLQLFTDGLDRIETDMFGSDVVGTGEDGDLLQALS